MAEAQHEETQEPKKWRGILQLLIIAAIVIAAIFLARAPQQDFLELNVETEGQQVAPTASTMQPRSTSASHKIDLTGTVVTLGNVVVIPEAAGDIVFVSEKFRAGGEFTADETLARIDRTEYDIALELSRLDVEFAKEHLREVKDRHGRSAEYLATRADGTVHPWPSLDGAIEKAEILLESAKKKLELAEIQVDKTRIRMPFDGYVLSSSLSVGQVVSSASTIGDVFQKNQLRVRAKISQVDLASLGPVNGRTAVVQANGRTYRTEVERASSVIDLETRLASLYLRFIDEESLTEMPRPGTFADVAVDGPTRESVFLLPESARQLNSTVWIVEDEKLVAFEPVSRGYDGDMWIVDTFDTKDGVVLGSVSGARDGLIVRAVSAVTN